MQELLLQQYSFSLNGATILLFAAAVLIFVAILVFAFARRAHKGNDLIQHARYGFLGKPLYNLVAVAFMVGVLGVVGYGIYQDQNFEIRANKTVSAEITTTILSRNGDSAQVEFNLVPTVEGKAWGVDGNKFDIYWNIEGPTELTFVEQAKSAADISKFNRNIKIGSYRITALVVFEGASYTFTKDVIFRAI